MSINPVTTENGIGGLCKDISADIDFRQGMTQAARLAAKTISDAWTRHRGSEVVLTVIRDAINARR